jgi:hypothetical protein
MPITGIVRPAVFLWNEYQVEVKTQRGIVSRKRRDCMYIQLRKKDEKVLEVARGEILTIILVLVLFQVFVTNCLAASVALQWDAVSDSDLAGYKVYYQANSSTMPFQGSIVDVKNQTSTTIGNLDPNNAYYFAVTAYNTSGVESSYSNVVNIPEMVSPTTSIVTPVSNASVSGTVTINVSAIDNVGVTKVEYYVNGVVQDSATSSPYVFSWNSASLSSGSYTLIAKAYDAAGNVGQSNSVVVKVVTDTTAPSVTLTSPTNGSTLNGITAITASASDNIGVSKVEFYKNDVLISATNVAPYKYNWDTTSVANGTYTLSAKAYDTSGNVGQTLKTTVTVSNVSTVDATAPTVSITSPSAGSKVGGVITINASATDSVGVTKVAFYVDGVLKATDTASPFSYGWDTKTSTNGSHTLMVKAYDAAGNSRASSASVAVFNDTTAPTVSITSPSACSKVGGVITINTSATDSVGVTKVAFYVDGVLKATDTASPFSYGWDTKTSTNGSHTLMVKAYDAAGNSRASSAAITVFNDTTAPVISIVSPSNSAVVTGIVTVNAIASDNVGVTKVLFFVDGVQKTIDIAYPYGYTWDTKSSANGSHILMAKAYDAAGNVRQSSNITVTVRN